MAQEACPVDIWTEQLEQRHLPLLKNWIGRTAGRFTANDLPLYAEQLSSWFETCKLESGRTDCLVSVYETPVGISGLINRRADPNSAELYLFLGESNYNSIRTATYATLRMLDRAFQEQGLASVYATIYARHEDYLAALDQMGFSKTPAKDGLIRVKVGKDMFLSRKYLF